VFSTLLILALFGYGIFILIQYIPQRIESATVNSILEQLYEQNAATPFSDMREVDAAVRKQLNINQMDDMRDNFKVTGNRGKFTVTVDYERELNLLYTIKTIQHHDELTL
jgi:hypothetical protein